MEDKKRAWIYCRIANGDPESMEAQRNELAAYAEHMGYELVGESHDIGSGLNYDRDGITEISDAAASGRMDTVFIKAFSCLGRDTYLNLEYIEQLNQQGIEVFSLAEGAIQSTNQDEMISYFASKMQL